MATLMHKYAHYTYLFDGNTKMTVRVVCCFAVALNTPFMHVT